MAWASHGKRERWRGAQDHEALGLIISLALWGEAELAVSLTATEIEWQLNVNKRHSNCHEGGGMEKRNILDWIKGVMIV